MIQPGEGVGAVGSSSIGEPSMQLTLNVFHFSGIASKNVTISGLPRFKELINAADTSSTANMTGALCKDAEPVLAQVQFVPLRNVVEPLVERTSSWPPWVQTSMTYLFPDQSAGKKRGRDEDASIRPATLSPWGIKFQVKWFACQIQRTEMQTILHSLRKEYPEWIILGEPHFQRVDHKGPYVYMCQKDI